jgi:ubiquitin
MGYGEYLARKRSAATEEGAAAMMGGNATDVMLARRGRSNARQPLVKDPSVMAGLKADEDAYWAKQAEHNKGIAQSATDARTKQDAAFGKAKKAYGERVQADETALTNYGSQQSTRLQDEATRRYNEGRYGSLTGARQGQQSRRRFGGR